MRDYVSVGSTPPEEYCAQVGGDDYGLLAREECRRYIRTIRHVLGPEPEGAELKIKSFPHDFGSYLEVVCYFDDEKPASVEYAFECESGVVPNWLPEVP